MPNHVLFDNARGFWDLAHLRKVPLLQTYPAFEALVRDPSTPPGPSAATHDDKNFSAYHEPSVTYSNMYPFVVTALLSLGNPDGPVGLVRIGDRSYATERLEEDGTTSLFQIMPNGNCRGASVQISGRHSVLQIDKRDMTDVTMALLFAMSDTDPDIKQKLEDAKMAVQTEDDEALLHCSFYLSDALYYAIKKEALKVKMEGGNISLMTSQTVASGAMSGTVITGKPVMLTGGKVASSKKATTLGDAKKIPEFQDWANSRHWSAEEEALIPDFPDDYPIQPEVLQIARRFVETHNDRRPMVNFMWRGITSYGKSTGVELMANILHTPLLRLTCHSSMETQEFLSNIVPVSQREILPEDLPCFEEMVMEPELAYQKLTGKEDPNATGQMCLDAYAEYIAAHTNGGEKNLFKQVESNLVKGLSHGYIVEVQELSRIKDPGVLVGLNEYDRPGAIIPLVDGSFVRRHKDAMVVYTDNVGYSSCRPLDPSVLRRMAFIKDSYEMPKEDALARVVYNTKFANADMLDVMYETWNKIRAFCVDKDITEGTTSLTELEMWAQAVMADGYSNLIDNCLDCVVAKATSVPEEQKEIMSSVVAITLS